VGRQGMYYQAPLLNHCPPSSNGINAGPRR
jgi:hypothetical protein